MDSVMAMLIMIGGFILVGTAPIWIPFLILLLFNVFIADPIDRATGCGKYYKGKR